MYDIHCHILPFIDDGAKDVQDSVDMCRILSGAGVDKIVATPHFIEGEAEAYVSVIYERIELVTQENEMQNIDIELLPGMEVFITPNLVRLYEDGKIIGLNNKKYLLVEFPMFESMPPYIEDVMFSLQLKGVHPVIAHPERYRHVQEHPNTVYRLIERGCVIQVNSSSIEGAMGKKVQKAAELLLQHNMVHIVASDSHSARGRISLFSTSYDMISKRFGKAYADRLYTENPRCVIEGAEVEIQDPERVEKKLFWFV